MSGATTATPVSAGFVAGEEAGAWAFLERTARVEAATCADGMTTGASRRRLSAMRTPSSVRSSSLMSVPSSTSASAFTRLTSVWRSVGCLLYSTQCCCIFVISVIVASGAVARRDRRRASRRSGASPAPRYGRQIPLNSRWQWLGWSCALRWARSPDRTPGRGGSG